MTARLPLPLLMQNVVRPVVDGIFHDPNHDQGTPPTHFMVLAVEVGQPLTAGQFVTNLDMHQFARVADYLHQMAQLVLRNQALVAPLAPVTPEPQMPEAANDTDKVH